MDSESILGPRRGTQPRLSIAGGRSRPRLAARLAMCCCSPAFPPPLACVARAASDQARCSSTPSVCCVLKPLECPSAPLLD